MARKKVDEVQVENSVDVIKQAEYKIWTNANKAG